MNAFRQYPKQDTEARKGTQRFRVALKDADRFKHMYTCRRHGWTACHSHSHSVPDQSDTAWMRSRWNIWHFNPQRSAFSLWVCRYACVFLSPSHTPNHKRFKPADEWCAKINHPYGIRLRVHAFLLASVSDYVLIYFDRTDCGTQGWCRIYWQVLWTSGSALRSAHDLGPHVGVCLVLKTNFLFGSDRADRKKTNSECVSVSEVFSRRSEE